MDSKNIYIAASHTARKVKWEYQTKDTEWLFVGDGIDFKIDEVQERIASFLSGEKLYFVNGRHDSCSIMKNLTANEIAHKLKEQNILICDLDFKKFIEFNHVGIMRYGEVES